jgi:hypothetical protein
MTECCVFRHDLCVSDIDQGQHVPDVAINVVFHDQAFVGENHEAIFPFNRLVVFQSALSSRTADRNVAHLCTNTHTRIYTLTAFACALHEYMHLIKR